MKSLQEIWSNVGQETEELKTNYYATLLTIGIHGRTRISVSENDIDKKFGNNFRRLFMPDNKNVKIRLTVKIKYENLKDDNDTKSSRYLIYIHNMDKNLNKNIFKAELRKYEGQPVGRDIESDEEYEEKFCKIIDSDKIESWKDIISIFDI